MLLLPLEPRVAAKYLVGALRLLGGKGSGNFGHSGRPGEVGGSGDLFHGTTLDAAKAIKTQGLKPGHGGKAFAGKNLDLALNYASQYVEDVAVVVIHKSAAKFFTGNPTWAQPGHFSPKKIPAKYIKEVRVYKSSQIDSRPGEFPNQTGGEALKYKTLKEGLDPDDILVVFPISTLETLGGQGSGNFGHSGRLGERGGSAEGTGGGEKTRNARSLRALKAFIPITAANQRHAEKNELSVRNMIGGTRTDDNLPVDVVTTIKGRMHGVEVKTFINNTNDKITMRKAAIEKKVAWGRSNHASVHTVVIDDRDKFGSKHYSGHRIYYAKGSGSFRLNSLTKVTSPQHLKELLSK